MKVFLFYHKTKILTIYVFFIDILYQRRRVSVWYPLLDWERFKSSMHFELKFYIISTWDSFPCDYCLYCRMKLGLRPSRQLNWMPSLEVVQSNIGNSKVMNLTNSCHTSSLALYLWRAVLLLGSKSLKRRSLKHGCIFAEGRELYELKRYGRFMCCAPFSIFCSIIPGCCLTCSGSLRPVIVKPWWRVCLR